MTDRRAMLGALVGAAGASLAGCASPSASTTQAAAVKTALYRNVGEVLEHFEVDADAATLTRKGAVRLPAGVQYAWPHPSHKVLYLSSSNRGSDLPGEVHHLSAFRIDAATGSLQALGAPMPLKARSIHMSVDRAGRFVLIAYSEPAGVSVHRIEADGRIGGEVAQSAALDLGIYPHQILATPGNRAVLLVARGHNAHAGKPEDPGALKLLRFEDGVLTLQQSVAPNGGYGFGPRHVDFHPTQPWVYVSLERQNRLDVFRLEGERLSSTPLFSTSTLGQPGNVRPRQLPSAIHVHPNGSVVYVANRALATEPYNGRKVFQSGENTVSVFSIHPRTGEPTLIQSIDTRAYHVRTFSIDASARVLVAASIAPMEVREGDRVVTVPASLSVFRILADGRLEFSRRYGVATERNFQWWMGMVCLPTSA